MLRLRSLLFLAICSLTALPAVAHSFAVGSCAPRLQSFATISAAVSSVPPGSTIFVCPGTYPEQVTITQPLTLQGIASSNQDQAVIAVPVAGLTGNITSIFGQTVAAQVLVQGVGPVRIINITVDGAGGDTGCAGGTWLSGIFYASSSSGEVSHVKASNQISGGCGVGIWAENGDSINKSVRIEDNTVHDNDSVGIFTAAGTTPSLNASIRGNLVSVNTGLIGILSDNVTGWVTENDVSNAMFGMVDAGPGVSISENNISQTTAGIVLENGGSIRENRLSSSGIGVWFFSDGGSVRSNRLVSMSLAAIEFNCSSATVSHNTINDAAVGLDNVPTGLRTTNTFYNTATIQTDGCASTPLVASSARTAAPSAGRSGDSIWQWRTPASPLGSLR